MTTSVDNNNITNDLTSISNVTINVQSYRNKNKHTDTNIINDSDTDKNNITQQQNNTDNNNNNINNDNNNVNDTTIDIKRLSLETLNNLNSLKALPKQNDNKINNNNESIQNNNTLPGLPKPILLTDNITLRQRLTDRLNNLRSTANSNNSSGLNDNNNNKSHSNSIIQLQHNYNNDIQLERFIYTPDQWYIKLYNFLLQCIICYNAISITLRLTIGYDYITTRYTFVNTLDIISDIYYVTNIILKTRLAYESHGSYVTNSQHILHRYKTTYELHYDIISLSPFIDYILFAVHQPFASYCIRLCRLLQLRYLSRYINRLDSTPGVNILYIRIFKLFITFYFLSHIMGCFWWCFILPPYGHTDNNNDWLPSQLLLDSNLSTRYIHCLYIAVGSMTGRYEEGVPQTTGQYLYGILLYIIGTLYVGM